LALVPNVEATVVVIVVITVDEADGRRGIRTSHRGLPTKLKVGDKTWTFRQALLFPGVRRLPHGGHA
jgi:hypothetical protein